MAYPDVILGDNPLHYWEWPSGGSVALVQDYGSSPAHLFQQTSWNTGYAGVWDGGLAGYSGGGGRTQTDVSIALVAPISFEVWGWVAHTPGVAMVTLGADGVTANSVDMFLSGTLNPTFNAGGKSVIAAAPVTPYAWHHYVLVYSGGVVTGYVDAAPVGSLGGGAAIPTPHVLALGCNTNATAFWNGLIASAAVYGYALIGAQITNHFNAAIDKGVFPQYVGSPVGGFSGSGALPPSSSADIGAILKAVRRTY